MACTYDSLDMMFKFTFRATAMALRSSRGSLPADSLPRRLAGVKLLPPPSC
jgi:hypothetical protein